MDTRQVTQEVAPPVPARTGLRGERGVGLLELVVALVITSVVVAITFSSFFQTQREAERVSTAVERRQNARAAVQILERDLRMAGSGWGHNPARGCYNGAPLSVPPLQFGYGGGATANDSVVVLGGWDKATTLRDVMPTPASVIKAINTTGFAPGDFCVVTNGTDAHLFQATLVTTTPQEIQHDLSSPYNLAGGHASWPVGGYAIGARIYRATWVSYRVETAGYRRPSLVRREAGRPEQVVASDVQQFKVNYALEDGSVTRNPADLSTVDRVIPVVRTVALATGRPSVIDSAWANIRPRTF